MKIAGVLSWFDESPHWLATVVAGMGRFCDTVIAVDGAYKLYPGARARSHPSQAEAILLAAEAAGIGCLVHRPDGVFEGNEIEKRNQTLDLARALLTPVDDWVFVCDADLHILQCKPETIRAELEHTEHNVAAYTVLDTKDFLADDAGLADYAKRRPIDTEWTSRTPDLYRLLPDLHYEGVHWGVAATIGGEKRFLRGPVPNDLLETPLNLDASLVVYHRTEDRTMSRRNAAAGYYKARDVFNTEPVDQAGVIAGLNLN